MLKPLTLSFFANEWSASTSGGGKERCKCGVYI